MGEPYDTFPEALRADYRVSGWYQNNGISICLASETMETHIHFHARIFVIVEWADCHAVTVDTDAVHLCRLSGGNIAFYCFKCIHCIILLGNKKGTRRFLQRKRQVSVRDPYSVFVLRRFLLRLFLLFLREPNIFGFCRFSKKEKNKTIILIMNTKVLSRVERKKP